MWKLFFWIWISYFDNSFNLQHNYNDFLIMKFISGPAPSTTIFLFVVFFIVLSYLMIYFYLLTLKNLGRGCSVYSFNFHQNFSFFMVKAVWCQLMSSLIMFGPFWTDLIQQNKKQNRPFYLFCKFDNFW